MHHVHFQYVSTVPRNQSCARLFQLMDDLNPQLRSELLRDAYVTFNVFGSEEMAQYREFKRRTFAIAHLVPEEEFVVYGMVTFILGNVFHRSTRAIFSTVNSKRDTLHIAPQEKKSIAALREEEHVLRLAYQTFCEMIVSALLDEQDAIDFGSEWIWEDAPTAVKREEPRNQPLIDDFKALKGLRNQLFPTSEDVPPPHPTATTFLDQVSADFEQCKADGDHAVIVRVADRSVRLSAFQYRGPSEEFPDCPLIMRIWITGTGPSDVRAMRELGLALSPRSSLNCRFEFTVLPRELSLLTTWIPAWIRGQERQDPNPPPLPIRLAGQTAFSEFTGDPTVEMPLVERVADEAHKAFSSLEDENWLSVDYIWSLAARTAFDEWSTQHGS